MSMVNLILVPILSGIILYKVPLKAAKLLMLLVQGFLAVNVAILLMGSGNQPIFEFMGGEIPILFIALRGDRTTFVLAAFTIFLFTASLIYSYFEDFMNNRFLLLTLVLQGITTGLFLLDDIFTIFVFFEVSTVIATILIMFKKEVRNIYDGLFYFLIQIVSMMFYIMGIAYLYRMFGVLSLSELAYQISLGVPAQDLLLPFAFLLSGVGLKVGLFPMFSWVTRAYGTKSAPIASIALQSAVFIKASLWIFLRLYNLFAPTLGFQDFFLGVAFVTGVAGAVKSLAQRDIKLLLAYSTISQIGLLFMGIFLDHEVSYFGSLYHVLTHGVVKLLLFLCAGMIMDKYETHDMSQIRGVLKVMPLVGVMALLGILGITGAPFFNGAMSKYWLMYGSTGTVLEAAIWVINTGTMLVYMKYAFMLFGSPAALPQGVVRGFATKGVVLTALGISCVVAGIFGRQLVFGMFGVELTKSVSAVVEKALIYVAMAVGTFLLVRYVSPFVTKRMGYLRDSLSFPRSVFFLLAFFVTMVAYGMMLY